MYTFKIPIITRGPFGLNLRAWTRSIFLTLIIPFATGLGMASTIYSSPADTEGRYISLILSIFCSVHLGFVTILFIGYIRRYIPILRLWIFVGIIEAFVWMILVFYTGSVALMRDIKSYGILMMFCAPIFGCFLLYSVIIINSVIHTLKQNKNQRTLINQMDQNLNPNDISLYT